MKLRSVNEIPENSIVFLRMDLDLPIEEGKILDQSRLVKSLSTIALLQQKQCKIIVGGHMGRPEGRDEKLSLRPVFEAFNNLVSGEKNVFLADWENIEELENKIQANDILFLENLRFWSGEESNDPLFLENIIEKCNAYVDDAFAVAHRKAASIMLFKKLPGYYGLSFVEEAEKIGALVENPQKPLTIVLGGAKEDKLKYLGELVKLANGVLIGGKLPKIIREQNKTIEKNVVVAELREDGMDLSDKDIARFIELINCSKTIVWAGAMGFYERDDCQKGTEEIARAIAENSGYKVIAGGDTGASIEKLGLKDKIDFVCSGGGVMLEYLVKGTLPAWE